MSMEEGSIAFWMLFVVTLIGSLVMLALEDAEGAGTPHWEPEVGSIDENPISGYAGGWACRGPDNIVRRVWQDDDYAVVVSYTSNNGSTWQTSEVISSVWKAHTSAKIGGIVTLANNTTFVFFWTENADDTYNWYLAARWNWTGAWDIMEVYGSASNSVVYPKMAVNTTKVLMMGASGANTLRWKTYDHTTDTFSSGPSTLPQTWIGTWTYAYEYDITVNQSGYFYICSKSWSGSDYRFLVRDLDLIEAAIYMGTGSGVVGTYAPNIVCTSQDTLVIDSLVWYSALQNFGLWHGYQATPGSGFTKFYIHYAVMPPGDLFSVGQCIDDNDRITIYWANDTGTGGNCDISKTTADWDGTEPEFEANIVAAVYNYGTNDDTWYHTDWYDGIYPIVGGYSVNIPDAGWMGHHTWKDEVGTPDDYNFGLYWNATFHWYDWAPPAGPGPGGGSGGGGDLFSDEEGNPWYIPASLMQDLWVLFIVTAMFVGVATAFRKYVDKFAGWKYAQRRWQQYRRPIYGGYRQRGQRPAPRPKYRYRY